MPVISAFADHPTHPYVRVEVNWADTPSVQYAGVYRVDVATGECTPLRPYICYNGWELLLSCGVASNLCDEYAWPDKLHWNAKGHEIVGKALAESVFADCE